MLANDDGIGTTNMANWPSVQPSDGRIGAIDRFCMLTYQASSSAGRYAGGVASTLGFLCVVLLLSLGVAVWHASAMAQERDALVSLGCDLLQGYLFAKPNTAFPTVIW